jgi:hypothetical protein
MPASFSRVLYLSSTCYKWNDLYCVLPSECDKVILLLFIYLLMGRIVLELLSFEPLSTVTPCLAMYRQAGRQAYVHFYSINQI